MSGYMRLEFFDGRRTGVRTRFTIGFFSCVVGFDTGFCRVLQYLLFTRAISAALYSYGVACRMGSLLAQNATGLKTVAATRRVGIMSLW